MDRNRGLEDLIDAFGAQFGLHRTLQLKANIEALGIRSVSELVERAAELGLPSRAKDFISTFGSAPSAFGVLAQAAAEPARATESAPSFEDLVDAFGARFGLHRTPQLKANIEALGIRSVSELVERAAELGLPSQAKDFISTFGSAPSAFRMPAPSAAEPARAASRSASRRSPDDGVSASIDRPPRRVGSDRDYLRVLGYGRADDEVRGDYDTLKLKPHHDDLGDVASKLSLTIRQWKQHDGGPANWKHHKATHHFWNHCSSIVILEQAMAVANVLQAENSRLVDCAALLEVARKVDPSTRPVRHKVQSGRETGGANGTFRPWLRQMLHPAVLFFEFDASDSLPRLFAYAYPHSLEAQRNLAASVKVETARRTPEDVRSILEKVNVAGYLRLLPSRSHQRVLRSLVADLCESSNF